MYYAVDTKTHKQVGPARNDAQFARNDARRYHADTGAHSTVLKVEEVWTTQTLVDINVEG